MRCLPKIFLLFLVIGIITGCGQQSTSPVTTPSAHAQEDRWILVADYEKVKILLDKQSITTTRESGSVSSNNNNQSQYSKVERPIATCWITFNPKDVYKERFREISIETTPQLKDKTFNYVMFKTAYSLTERTYYTQEELYFDNGNLVYQKQGIGKWQSIIPGDKINEPVFEAVKKQLGIK